MENISFKGWKSSDGALCGAFDIVVTELLGGHRNLTIELHDLMRVLEDAELDALIARIIYEKNSRPIYGRA